MAERLDSSVGRVMEGGVLVFVGTMLGNLLGFGSKVAISRLMSPEVFGIFSLCVGIVALIEVFSTFGLGVGAARYIAYYRGQKEWETARSVMIRAARIGLASSVIVTVLCLLLSEAAARGPYRNIEGIGSLLRIAFLAIPFASALELMISIGRGHGDAIPKVLFVDLGRSGLLILAVIALAPLGHARSSVVWAFSLATALPACVCYGYARKRYGFALLAQGLHSLPLREIILFSLPMTVLPMMWVVLSSCDTMMLGHYKMAADVGLYNGALTLSRLLNPFMTSVVFIFLPIATGLYASGSREEFIRTYHVITKGVFIVSFPFNAILLIFSGDLLIAFFGSAYAGMASTMRLLVLGYLSSLMVSMNTATLTAAGRAKEQGLAATITISANILLNALLIPSYGTTGAALATAASMTLYNVLISIMLYRHAGVLPFTWDYARTLVAAGLSLAAMALAGQAPGPLWFRLPLAVGVYCGVLLFLVVLFRGLVRTDLIFLDLLARRTGLPLAGIKDRLEKGLIRGGTSSRG